jgi:hypothetical protein
MSAQGAKTIAIITIAASIPLLLSFNIKYQWFPQGLYGLLYFSGLLSVVVVPILLLSSVVIAIWIQVSPNDVKRMAFRWNLLSILIAGIAEVIFLAARYSPP